MISVVKRNQKQRLLPPALKTSADKPLTLAMTKLIKTFSDTIYLTVKGFVERRNLRLVLL